MFSLKDRTAIVTGAKQGIGKGIALALAAAGANVVLSDMQLDVTRQAADEVSKKTGARTLAVGCDVSNKKDVEAMVAATIKKFGSLYIMVNNAGIYPTKPLLEMTEEEWQKVLDVNAKGTFLCAQAASKQMVAQKKGGKIVNIASIAGLVGFQGLTHYCASKGGVVAFTRAAALELAPYKINVNAIAPGAIETPGIGKVDEKMLQGILAAVPWKRMGQPEDIAAAVLFLCSQEADYITGQTITVDGGWTVQ